MGGRRRVLALPTASLLSSPPASGGTQDPAHLLSRRPTCPTPGCFSEIEVAAFSWEREFRTELTVHPEGRVTRMWLSNGPPDDLCVRSRKI